MCAMHFAELHPSVSIAIICTLAFLVAPFVGAWTAVSTMHRIVPVGFREGDHLGRIVHQSIESVTMWARWWFPKNTRGFCGFPCVMGTYWKSPHAFTASGIMSIRDYWECNTMDRVIGFSHDRNEHVSNFWFVLTWFLNNSTEGVFRRSGFRMPTIFDSYFFAMITYIDQNIQVSSSSEHKWCIGVTAFSSSADARLTHWKSHPE